MTKHESNISIKKIPEIYSVEYDSELQVDDPEQDRSNYWVEGGYTVQGLYHRVKETDFVEDYELPEDGVYSIVRLLDFYKQYTGATELYKKMSNKEPRKQLVKKLKNSLIKSKKVLKKAVDNPYVGFQLKNSFFINLEESKESKLPSLTYDKEIDEFIDLMQVLIDSCDTVPDEVPFDSFGQNNETADITNGLILGVYDVVIKLYSENVTRDEIADDIIELSALIGIELKCKRITNTLSHLSELADADEMLLDE